MSGAVTELGRHLLKDKVQMVTLEATSDYWRIFYYLLESARAGGPAGVPGPDPAAQGPPEDR